MVIENSKYCIQCKSELRGRLGKKFCSDQCRATYHNQHKKIHEVAIQKVNSQIRQNRTILKTLCPIGKATIRKNVLVGMGFSFRHFTSIYATQKRVYYLCYDYAYSPITEKSTNEGTPIQKISIVQYQQYMKSFDPWSFKI